MQISTVFGSADEALRLWAAWSRGGLSTGYPTQAPFADMQGRGIPIPPCPDDAAIAVDRIMTGFYMQRGMHWLVVDFVYLRGMSYRKAAKRLRVDHKTVSARVDQVLEVVAEGLGMST